MFTDDFVKTLSNLGTKEHFDAFERNLVGEKDVTFEEEVKECVMRRYLSRNEIKC